MGKSYRVHCGDPEATGECGRKLRGQALPVNGGSYLDVSGRESGSFEGDKKLPVGNDRVVHEACWGGRAFGMWGAVACRVVPCGCALGGWEEGFMDAQ